MNVLVCGPEWAIVLKWSTWTSIVVILKHKPRTVSSPDLSITFGALTLDVSKLRKVVTVTVDKPRESHC